MGCLKLNIENPVLLKVLNGGNSLVSKSDERLYRYGYNGMEKDDEVSGIGNSYTTEFRQYDPRLGRWKSLDPLMMQFPSLSPYCAFDNNPIYYVDPYGLSATNGEGDPPGLPATTTDLNTGEEREWRVGDTFIGNDDQQYQLTNDSNDPWKIKVNDIGNVEITAKRGEPSTVWTRIWGGVQAIGGAIEAGIGAALISTGIGAPLGALLVFHGADQMATGIMQAATGESRNTLTHGAVKGVAKVCGASEDKANLIATGVDVSISLFGGGVGSIKLASSPSKLPKLKVVTDAEIDVIVGEKTVEVVGKSSNSKILSENLIKSGISRPANSAAHHIVAGTDPRALIARNILAKNGIDINSSLNGVFLPKNTSFANGDALIHSTIHTNAYYNAINMRLMNSSNVAEELMLISKEILNGTFTK
jgi:RHS repeat-associated protein